MLTFTNCRMTHRLHWKSVLNYLVQNNPIKQLLSFTRIRVVVAPDFYLSNECWESIFKFIINVCEYDNHRHLKTLSVVSKQFPSITNRLLFSLAIYNATRPFLLTSSIDSPASTLLTSRAMKMTSTRFSVKSLFFH